MRRSRRPSFTGVTADPRDALNARRGSGAAAQAAQRRADTERLARLRDLAAHNGRVTTPADLEDEGQPVVIVADLAGAAGNHVTILAELMASMKRAGRTRAQIDAVAAEAFAGGQQEFVALIDREAWVFTLEGRHTTLAAEKQRLADQRLVAHPEELDEEIAALEDRLLAAEHAPVWATP